MTKTRHDETFAEIYCRLFRAYRSAMFAGYVPTAKERETIRYMRARVATRGVPTGAAPAPVSLRIRNACARSGLRSELAREPRQAALPGLGG